MADRHATRATISPTRATTPARAAASTTSPTPSIPAKTFCAPPIFFSKTASIIETGPHKHAVQQTFFLYVYEPGGNRVEVANAGARLILAPDWKPIVWTEEERKKGQAWGLKTIESFHTYGHAAAAGRAADPEGSGTAARERWRAIPRLARIGV